jgi:hypothetical protein
MSHIQSFQICTTGFFSNYFFFFTRSASLLLAAFQSAVEILKDGSPSLSLYSHDYLQTNRFHLALNQFSAFNPYFFPKSISSLHPFPRIPG